MCTGMPSSTYFHNRGAVGCCTASDSATRVLHCLEAMMSVREGACACVFSVYCAVDARLLTLSSKGGG